MSTALAKVETLSLKLPATAEDVAKLEAAAADLASLQAEIEVTDDASYGAADELLTQAVQLLDAAKICRSSVTGPVYKAIKEVEARFKPAMSQLEGFILRAKTEIGRYRTTLANEAHAARQAAALAAQTGDADGLVDSLNAADALSAPVVGAGAKVKIRWVVKRITPELLPFPAWWCPDEAAIQEVALAHKGEEPPVIPGVVFERVAAVSAKH